MIFDKKEFLLILLLMIISIITSFTLGVRVGKQFSFRAAGVTDEDVERVNLQSGQEESMDEILNEKAQQVDVEGGEESDTTAQKLQNEIDQIAKGGQKVAIPKVEGNVNAKTKDMAPLEDSQGKVVNEKEMAMAQKEAMPEENQEKMQGLEKDLNKKAQYIGKYTIQLGSHKTINEAREFADGFTIRGYDPIINEVNLKNRGTWYRVSLGVFSNAAMAKEYINKEKSLFQSQDYVIVEIK